MTIQTILASSAVAIASVVPFSCTYAPGLGSGPSDPGAPPCAAHVWSFPGDVPDCDLDGSQTWSVLTRSLLPGECADMGGAQIGPSLCFGIDY